MFTYFITFNILAIPQSMWNLSSLTRDLTHASALGAWSPLTTKPPRGVPCLLILHIIVYIC